MWEKTRSSRHQWELVCVTNNETTHGSFKQDLESVNKWAKAKYGRHIQTGSVTGCIGGKLFKCVEHVNCNHCYKIEPYQGLYCALSIANDTAHEAGAPIPPPRGIHDSVKEIIQAQVKVGGCPCAIETALYQDRSVPNNLLPTYSQIRNYVYKNAHDDSAVFGVTELRDFISRFMMKSPTDPRFEGFGDCDLIIIGQHEG